MYYLHDLSFHDKLTNKDCSSGTSVFIVDFEQVNVGWEVAIFSHLAHFPPALCFSKAVTRWCSIKKVFLNFFL